MDFSPPYAILDGGGYGSKGDGSSLEDESAEAVDVMNQAKTGKPPRHLSVMRHCVSTARLVPSEEFVCTSDSTNFPD